MTTRTTPWPAGMPCWADTMTGDVAAAQAFYGAVLGWTFGAASAEFGGYSNASKGDRLVAGLGPAMDGARSAWTMYLATEDIDATAAAVTAHGGTVMGGPHAVGDLGHMLVAGDPAGAVFGAWQAGTHTGSQVVNEPGSLMWEDLRSTDPATAISFYENVFVYETRPMEMAGPDYRTFHLPGDDAPMGGMGGMFGDDGPSHWL
ncbi:MAG: VOC family protein, partial [Mycobacteriales bacterium]